MLTAAHVLESAVSVRVRFVGEDGATRQFEGEIAFLDRSADIAVIRIADDGARLDQFPPVAFGRIGQAADCEALGFPRFKMRRARGADGTVTEYRDTRHARGSAVPLSNLRDGSLELHVAAPERDPDKEHSPWEGMSGAAVWSGDRIIGLVREHLRADGLGTLTASRADRWRSRLTSDQAIALQGLIGFPADASRLLTVGPHTRMLDEYLAAAERAAARHPDDIRTVSRMTPPPLTDVYLSQLADRQETALPPGTAGAGQQLQPELRAGARLPATEILSQGGTCVVLAGPGGGKSSLLRTCLAASVGRWRRGLADTAVPVLVPAVQLTAKPAKPLFDAVADAVNAELTQHGLPQKLTADFFRAPPGPGVPWLLLVDGVDEITSPVTRQRLLDELRAIAQGPYTPAFRFVIATRPLPPGEVDLLGTDVPWYQLQPFTSGDIRKVASDWFKALRLPDADSMTARFAAELARRARLPDLARTPLMTAMLCQLFAAAPDNELPGSRGEIYRKFTELLYGRLRAEGLSGAEKQAVAGLERHDAEARERTRQVITKLDDLIGELAVQRRAGDDRPALDVIAAQPDGRTPAKVPAAEWRAFLDAAVRRSGTLTAYAGDFRFLHPTLQDYLAARHVTRSGQDRARIVRQALHTRSLLGPTRWSPPDEDPSYISFVLDPGDRDTADGARELERAAARSGIEGCRFIAALARLGTRLPEPAVRRAVTVLEHAARSKKDKYPDNTVPAARVLVDIDRARGLDSLTFLALQSTGGSRRFQAVREVAALDRPRAGDLLEALAQDPDFVTMDRLKAARWLVSLDRARGDTTLEALARSTTLPFDYRAEAARVLAGLDHTRGAGLLEEMASDQALSMSYRERAARVLGQLDPGRCGDLLETLILESLIPDPPGGGYHLRERLTRVLADVDRPRTVRFLQSLVGAPGNRSAGHHWATRALASVSEQPPATGKARTLPRINDPRTDTWTMQELSRLSRQMIRRRTDRYSPGAPDTPQDADHDLPEELLPRLDDPRAADLLNTIARDGSPHRDFERVTAAWQLSRINDPRAADLLAALARDNGLSWVWRLKAIEVLAELDNQRALNLMNILAGDPSLDSRERRRVTRSRTGKQLLAQLPPHMHPLRQAPVECRQGSAPGMGL